MPPPSLTSQHMPHVDALRALAVISVFIYHLSSSALPGGFSGVDIFFVISGFIVSASVIQKKTYNFSDFFTGFYARRLLRVMPALLVMLVATSLASAILIPDAWLSGRHRLTESYAFFGLSNFILSKTSDDYFSPTAEFNPYTHTWSLGVEEQFYFLFPFLFAFLAISSKKKWISGVLFIIGMLASLWAAISLMDTERTTAYYSIISRFWQLACGVLLFIVIQIKFKIFQKENSKEKISWLFGLIGLLILLTGFFTASPATFPWPGALWTTAGALLFLGGWINIKKETRTYAIISSKPIQYIGKLSYSLYLWHWPVFVIFRWTLGLETISKIIAAALISVIISIFSFNFIERPARSLIHNWKKPQWLLIFGTLIVIFACWGISQKISAIKPRISLHPTAHNPADWYPYGENSHPDIPNCTANTKNINIFETNLIEYTTEGAGCKNKPQQYIKTIHAIGDSHNLGYAALYKLTTLFTGFRIISYTNGGCPMMSLQPERESSSHCQINQKNTLNALSQEIKSGDIIFLPSLRLPRFADQWIRFSDASVENALFSEISAKDRAKSVQDAKILLARFVEQGATVVFEAPKPIFKSPTYRCAAKYQQSNPICADGSNVNRENQLRLREPVVNSLYILATDMPQHVSVWDPFSILCPIGKECSSYKDGRPIFFDADHISTYGSSLIAPSFITHLQSVAPATGK